MVFECAILNDLKYEAEAKGDDAEAARIDDRLGFLTPILKGFLTEMGLEAANLGIQVYGGHGYIKSNHMEQILRDVRIATVWEGTTGIQALDLLGRKIMLQKLKPFHQHIADVYSYCWALLREGGGRNLRKHALKLLVGAAQWQLLTYRIAIQAGR